MQRKVLSLCLPRLATDRRRRSRPGGARRERSAPLLLVTPRRGQQVVAACCALSEHGGVRPGMTVAHARALLPAGARVEPYDEAEQRRVLEALARWALRFSPVVSVDGLDGLLLDMTGCDRLYRGTGRMVGVVAGRVRRLGFGVRWALAPTVGGAWALARFGPAEGPEDAGVIADPAELRRALKPLPVSALRLPEEVVEALALVGVDRIGHLLGMPRAELAVRFGPHLPRRLDQALGRVFEPVQPLRPEGVLRVERAFAGPVKRLDAVQVTAERLVDELAGLLEQRQQGVRTLRLRAERYDAPPVEHALTLSRPSARARHVWSLLRPAVERLHLGHGVERLVLTATQTEPLRHRQALCGDWRDDAEAAEADRHIGELVDVLGARLGRGGVTRCRAVETHVPERVFVDEPAEDTALRHGAPVTALAPVDRPSLLYANPEPARVSALAPDGPLVSLTVRGRTHRVVTTVGPERLTARWWLVKRATAARDYFKVQDEAGRWWWVYRRVGRGAWFVHGRWV